MLLSLTIPLVSSALFLIIYFCIDPYQTFPFTSESKRMGILVKDNRTGEITFYMKGADTVMTRIVQYNDWLEEECGNMAREGLYLSLSLSLSLFTARQKLRFP